MTLNGLIITKQNRFSSFKVQDINTATLSARVSCNIHVGDIVVDINEKPLNNHDNLFTAQLLSTEILVSIRNYTPRNIQNVIVIEIQLITIVVRPLNQILHF